MFQEKTKVCSNCRQENTSDATQCAHCGASLLSATTIIVPDKPVGKTRLEYLTHLIKQHNDALVLYVTGEDQPILLKGSGRVILGRQVGESQATVLDLTRYGAHRLGVSRQHAMIVPTNEGYLIEDLGSTNGTAVNEKRLFPNVPQALRNGDLIRLGQLILFAYFSPKTSRPQTASEHIIYLVERVEGGATAQQKLTLDRMMNQIIPYLRALAEIQGVVEIVMGYTPAEVNLHSISVAQDGAYIFVGLVGGADAIQFVQDKVNAWRQKRAAQKIKTAPIGDEGKPDEKAAEATAAEPPPEDAAGGDPLSDTLKRDQLNPELVRELRESQAQLAKEWLAQIAPKLPEADRDACVQKLLPNLISLSLSALELSTSAPAPANP